jgi:hypothetical protein
MWNISWLAEELLACLQGLSFMELAKQIQNFARSIETISEKCGLANSLIKLEVITYFIPVGIWFSRYQHNAFLEVFGFCGLYMEVGQIHM